MANPFFGGTSSAVQSAQSVTVYLGQTGTGQTGAQASGPYFQAAQASTLIAPPQAGTFGVQDFIRRLIAKTPLRWTSASAQSYTLPTSQNGLFAGLLAGAAVGLATLWQMAVYCLKQTRLATATDLNLDIAYLDFFGTFQPRFLGETDSSFRTRLQQFFVVDRSRLANIAALVQSFVANLPPLTLQAATILAFDVPEAGLDTNLGGLDEAFNPQYITVYVFDAQSDPVSAARYGIAPPQFCILLNYPRNDYQWFWDSSYWDNDYWTSGQHQALTAPPYPALDLLIEQFKALGTQQVYVSNIAY